jgi:hypothetical protein
MTSTVLQEHATNKCLHYELHSKVGDHLVCYCVKCLKKYELTAHQVQHA